MKLGKKPPRYDKRTLMLAKYLRPRILAAPNVVSDWTAAIRQWPVMLNDNIGDCTIVAAAHLIQLWTAWAKDQVIVADADVLAAYEAVSGYKPSDPNSDQGAVELDVLKYWRTTGIAGHKIGAFTALEPQNINHVKVSVEEFGGVYIGLALPLTAQDQKVWSVVPNAGPDGAAGSWGGHAVPVVAYDQEGLTCVTWGELKRMTWQFWQTYTDEAYAIFSADWINDAGKSPGALDIAAIQTDLVAL